MRVLWVGICYADKSTSYPSEVAATTDVLRRPARRASECGLLSVSHGARWGRGWRHVRGGIAAVVLIVVLIVVIIGVRERVE